MPIVLETNGINLTGTTNIQKYDTYLRDTVGTTNNLTSEPTASTAKIDIAAISACTVYTIFLDTAGKVYSVGENGTGQLGLGNTSQITTPAPVTFFNTTQIASIYAGAGHTIFQDTAGKVYAAGRGQFGQLGLGDSSQRSNPTLIPYFNNILIKSVSTRGYFTIFLDIFGKVYASGYNTSGQLGLGSTADVFTPAPIPFFNNILISSVHAGDAYTVFVDTLGKVYSVGLNTSGQLGLGDEAQRTTPVQIPYFNTIPIKSVSAGFAHTIFLDTDGKVYAVGSAGSGELGFSSGRISTPAPVTYFNNIPIASVYAGRDYSMFIDTAGVVYATGSGNSGQLGFGGSSSISTPAPIPYFNNIQMKSVAVTTQNYTIFLDITGKVYVVGRNANGQLGLGDTTGILDIVPIPYFDITQVTVGATIGTGNDLNHKLFTLSTAGYYLLSFPISTIVNINNGPDIALKGNYTAIINTRSSVLPTINNNFTSSNYLTAIPFPPTISITSFVIRYHLRIPTYTPKQLTVETVKTVGQYINPQDSREPNVSEWKLAYYTHSRTTEAQTTYSVNFPHNSICDILIVGGGGGGDREIGGGGGGGAVLYATNINLPPNTYIIKVGKGGTQGVKGSQSEAFGAICLGGGSTVNSGWGNPENGTSGGSGSGASSGSGGASGGGIGISSIGTFLPPIKSVDGIITLYNGNLGGSCLGQNASGQVLCGGGGGAGRPGNFGDSGAQRTSRAIWLAAGSPGKGGDGVLVNITGNDYYWGAGGGGAGHITHSGDGGLGGGGGGGRSNSVVDTIGFGGGSAINTGLTPTGINGGNAGDSTGSGGGGGAWQASTGGNGGSGIVIIRYRIVPITINNDYSYFAFPYQPVDVVEIKTGVGGWRLVRFLQPAANAWHPVNDDLAGTTTYGIAYNYTNSWSIPFGTYDEFCFSTFGLRYWLYTTKYQAIGQIYSGTARNIIRSSISATPYTANWYNRGAGAPEDPWIGLRSHNTAPASNPDAGGDLILYGENSFSSSHWSLPAISVDGGACVWVRDSTVTNIQTSYTVNFPDPAGTACDILVVGGGGGGARRMGGGGGSGALIYDTNVTLTGTYTINIGGGGAGSSISGNVADNAFTTVEAKRGSSGSASEIIQNSAVIYRATGGSGGLGGNTSYANPSIYLPLAGGSGGGNGGKDNAYGGLLSTNNIVGGVAVAVSNNTYQRNALQEPTYTSLVCFGNEGGIGGGDSPWLGSGGGGAGARGADVDTLGNRSAHNTGGLGGVGKLINITNTPTYYAGGGGGGNWLDSGGAFYNDGGLGGGGRSGTNTIVPVAGTNGLGGGGGGDGSDVFGGANGGSGIVIIRYLRKKVFYDAQWTYNALNTNVYHLGNVGIGTTNPTNALHVVGDTFSTTYSGGSKNFKIEHPLKINKWLYHGCVEGPRFDNIYRGKKIIIDGNAEVDIDKECNTTGGMTPGTFPALNTNYQLYLQNNDTFDRVKGTIEGSKIRIESRNTTDEIEVDWLVVGERHDQNVINPDFTDHDGNLICEHYYPGYNMYNSGENQLLQDVSAVASVATVAAVANIDITVEYTANEISNDSSNIIIEEYTSNTSNTSNINDI